MHYTDRIYLIMSIGIYRGGTDSTADFKASIWSTGIAGLHLYDAGFTLWTWLRITPKILICYHGINIIWSTFLWLSLVERYNRNDNKSVLLSSFYVVFAIYSAIIYRYICRYAANRQTLQVDVLDYTIPAYPYLYNEMNAIRGYSDNQK